MATFPQTLRRMNENPIARAELSHQQRSTETQRKWRRFPLIFGVMLIVGGLSYMALRAAPLLAPPLGIPAFQLDAVLRDWFDTVTILIGALIMIHHLAFATAALQVAATSIAREKQGRTWESLLLTGVDARRIVYGKWGATMRMLWNAYRPLLALRFAVALWMALASGITRFTSSSPSASVLDVILIGIVTAVFPLCYAAFTVTLGLVASLLVTRETAAYRLAALFHFCTIVVSLSLILLSFTLPFNEYHPGLVSLIPALFVTPLDGGMLALLGMIASNGAISLHYLLGLVLCIGLYGGLTWMALRFAQWLTVRQRALPPV